MNKRTPSIMDMLEKIKVNKLISVLIYPLIGWTLCGMVMFIGMEITSETITLIIHAIAAPIIFAIVSLNYFKRFIYDPPLKTAIVFVSFVFLMDFFFVALLINKSLEMFANILGTWIPFVLIFVSVYLTGQYTKKLD